MSDTPAGTGWWQASDGRWYPPEQHPDYRRPEPPPSQWGGYGQQPPPYGSPYPPYAQYGGYPTGPQTSSKATAALVLSIVSFVFCPVIPAIVALVLAAQASREIRESNGRFTGQGMVTASRIISVANLVLVALAAIALVAILPSAVDDIEDVADNAQDAFTKAELREAADAADVYYEENGAYPMNPQALAGIATSLSFVPATSPRGSGVIAAQSTSESMTFATASGSGECFYLRTTPSAFAYARDTGCGPFSAQVFEDEW